jgi:hypothetical protein
MRAVRRRGWSNAQGARRWQRVVKSQALRDLRRNESGKLPVAFDPLTGAMCSSDVGRSPTGAEM